MNVNLGMEGMWKEMTVTDFKILSQNSPGGTDEDHENISCFIADLREKNSKLRPSDCEAGALNTRPRFGLHCII
jgi:hypothetical protein